MKKAIFLMAGAFLISLSAALAQTDTTGVRANDPTKDMVKISSTELPQPVQDALSSSSYQGWETGEIYRSQNSDKYMIRVGDASKHEYHYFDANGKPINKKEK